MTQPQPATDHIDVSPLVALIPEAIRNEIVLICTVLLTVGQLAGAFLGDLGHSRWVLFATAAATIILGALQRDSVTPTHHVAVDKRDVKTSVVVSPVPPPNEVGDPGIAITPVAAGTSVTVHSAGQVSPVPVAGSTADNLPPLDQNPLDPDR